MRKIIVIFFLLFAFITQINAQNVSKGFKYVEEHEYDKAMKIFTKAVNSGKNVLVGKYGIAVVYTRPDYSSPNNIRAYKFLLSVKENFSDFSSYTQQQYEKDYGMSVQNIDTLTQWILNTEYKKAKEKRDLKTINNFLDTYSETDQANKLEYFRDSIFFQDVKRESNLYSFQKFITDFPNSKFKTSAIAKRDSIWKNMYNEAYRSLEIFSITSFEDKYPDYPFTNDSTAIYKDLAKEAWALKLHYGFMISTVDYYGPFIKKAAPREMAYQALLVLLQPDIEKNNKKNVLDSIAKYEPYFGDLKKLQNLKDIINRPVSKVEKKSVGDKLNTEGYEYMPVLTGDNKTMYLCGEERKDNIDRDGEDIFVSYYRNNEWTEAYLVTELSTGYKNEAPLSVSADGNTLIVFTNGDIFISEKTKSGWSKPDPISEINTLGYWEADAVMSADGNAIIFASDRVGNIGAYHPFSNLFHGDLIGNIDLYVCTKTDDGWSAPVNLGTSINTPYAERTPFLHPDMKTLYFSSDGYAGLGKMDVFMNTRLNDSSWTEWSEPVNLGCEINTPSKEYGYKISTDGERAYYTFFIANHSDIYYVTLPEENRPEQVMIITGTVFNNFDEPLQADIFWEDLETGKRMGNLKSDPVDGEYIITLPLGKNYGFYVSKNGYYPLSDNIDLRVENVDYEIIKNFKLTKIEEIVYGDATIELKNVFFDFDKFDLKKESYPELKRLAEFLISQPNIKIEISGHTDNKGSKDYNKKLSQNRADEVKKYLISLGCSENQMLTVGYGDEKPVADNNTEEGRQKNRRVEFKVIK
ncbi:MAG: OmpA family protein [Bacteroidales bacterium]|nr:OmpA family protein [Bacteroidales bacterium]